MMRYVRLWGSLFKNAFSRELDYRANFVGRAFVEVIWIFTVVITFETTLRLTDRIGNFSPNEVWFFVGSLVTLDGLFMVLFHDNQRQFDRMIRHGMLDFHLLRPISSLFLANFRYVNVISVTNLVVGLSISGWAAHRLDMSLAALSLWAVYLLLGLVMVGCVGIALASVAFWTTQAGNLLWIFFEFYKLSFRPETIYEPWLRRILLTIFPAAFFISIPVQIALGKLHGLWLVYPWLIAATLCLFAGFIWKRGLKKYEGAMS